MIAEINKYNKNAGTAGARILHGNVISDRIGANFERHVVDMMRVLTKPVLMVVAIALMMPFLAACETVQSWTGGNNEIKVNNSTSEVSVTPKGGTGSYATGPAPGDRDLMAMTSKLSRGSVEIFDLEDGSPVYGGGVPSVNSIQMPQGIPLANDPRVTVYPLDGAPSSFGGMPQNWGGEATYSTAGVPSVMPSNAGYGQGAADTATIYFQHGSSRIGSGDDVKLEQAAEVAKFAPVERIRVEGYASQPTGVNDPVESRLINLRQSIKRAEAVSSTLIRKGVPAEKIKTTAWGDTRPSGAGDNQDRRVDILTGQ